MVNDSFNEYTIEKRREVKPSPFISEQDCSAVRTPLYPLYTFRNPASKQPIFNIPPCEFTSQLPPIGKWMLDRQFLPAHWLNIPDGNGKTIIEPINYLFVVPAKDEADANQIAIQALGNVGFTKGADEKHHSRDYYAWIGTTRAPQLRTVSGEFITFSNDSYLKQNDHFRAMGPSKITLDQQTVFVYAASVSEETAWDPKIQAGHFFVSFANARNALATRCMENGYHTSYAFADNVLSTTKQSTEDHDGNIVITILDAGKGNC